MMQADAELNKRRKEAGEKRQREMDETIRKCIAEGRAMVEEAVRKEKAEKEIKSAEKMETMYRDYRLILQEEERLRAEEERLRTEVIALATQLGEQTATLEIMEKQIKELKQELKELEQE